MASVPNMRLGPVERPNVKDQPADGAEGEGFGQLLSGLPTPARPPATPVAASAATTVESGGEGDDAEPAAGEVDAILALVAGQLAAPVQAAPVPPVAVVAQPSTPDGAAVVPGTPGDLVPLDPGSIGRAALLGATASVAVPAEAVSAAQIRFTRTPADAPAVEVQPAILAELALPKVPTAKGRTDRADAAPAESGKPLVPGEAIIAALEGGTLDPRRRDGRGPATQNGSSKTGDAVVTAAPASVPAATPAAPIVNLGFSPLTAGEPLPVPATQGAAPAASAATPELIIERQLDVSADGEWLDQLARDISRAAGGEGRMSFRLNPEHLGSLRVELALADHGTSVRMTADNETARNLLVDAQPKLVAEARAQGVRISETHVDLAGGQAGDPRRHETERREPQLRAARNTATQEEPARETARNGSDRYA